MNHDYDHEALRHLALHVGLLEQVAESGDEHVGLTIQNANSRYDCLVSVPTALAHPHAMGRLTMTITEAARQLAQVIWTDQKLTDPEAYAATVEQTAKQIERFVAALTHEWTHHDKVSYIKNGKYKEHQKAKVK